MTISREAIIFLTCTFLTNGLNAQEDASIKKTQDSKQFYDFALNNQPNIASFELVSKWLQEETVILIDLRSSSDFEKSHISGAISIPATELTEKSLRQVIPSKESRVVTYCDNNFSLSRKVALTTIADPTIKQLGYKNTFILQSSLSNKISPLSLEISPPI